MAQGTRIPLESIHEAIVELDNQGMVCKKIARELGVDKTGLRRYCDRHGIELAKRATVELSSDAIAKMAKRGKSVQEIATHLGFSQVAIKRWCDCNQVRVRDGFHVGVVIAKGKYITIACPDHPFADAKGYVRLHRLIAEIGVKRYLSRDEIVHHVDGNTFNNDPKNLEVTTRAKHASHHASNGESGWTRVRRRRANKT